jgi:hypothetical protein
MGKSWMFRKTNNDQNGRKKESKRRYVPVDYARELYSVGRLVLWPDVNLLGGWLLNSRQVPVPPVQREGLERRDELHRHFIPPPDLRTQPTRWIASIDTRSAHGNSTYDAESVI